MSTPTPRRPRSPGATRQQLDELDDLLQRMLALPVNPAAGDAAGGLPEAAAPVAVEEAPPCSESAASPVVDAPESAAPAPEEAPAAVEPSLEAVPPAEEAPAEPSPPVPPAPSPSLLRPPWAGVALWWRPLVWLNRFFDRRTFRLGALGRWLRRPSGRALLGWAGLFCLAAAAVLLARWIRWP